MELTRHVAESIERTDGGWGVIHSDTRVSKSTHLFPCVHARSRKMALSAISDGLRNTHHLAHQNTHQNGKTGNFGISTFVRLL
jgi:hypothetical protein